MLIQRTRKNQNASSCTKLYLRIVTPTRMNQKQSIVNKHLQHNYYKDVDKLCLTEIDKSQYTITEQKDEGNDVIYDVPNFNVSTIFECRRNNPDVSYERAYMAAEGNEYFTNILDHINGYQDRHGQILSCKKQQQQKISSPRHIQPRRRNQT